MRVALIGGVQGHAEALDAALAAAGRAAVDRAVVLGDLVGPGASADRAVERLRADPTLTLVVGALDRWVLGLEESRPGAELEAWVRSARRRLSLEQLAWLEDVPGHQALELGGWRLSLRASSLGSDAGSWLEGPLPSGPGVLGVRVGAELGWRRQDDGIQLVVPSLLPGNGDDPRARWVILTLPERGTPGVELRLETYDLRAELGRVEKLVKRGEIDRRSGVSYARRRLGRRAVTGRTVGTQTSLAPILVDLARAVYRPMSGRWPNHDVPVVHEVRVATRRLQEALQLLRAGAPSVEASAALRRLRRLRRKLAPRRAIDVQLLCLHEQIVLAEVSAAERRALVFALERMRHRVTARILEGRVRARYARHGLLVLDLAMGAAEAPWASQLALHLGRRVEACQRLVGALDREDDAPAHHELRKAMKRLRYAAELAELALGEGSAASLLLAFRPLQDQLGHYNDMYELRLLMDAGEVARALAPPALERLREHFQAERHRSFLAARASLSGALPGLFREVERLAASLPGR